MFLKRIGILGFKSFADKTGVEFSHGITAVVGPNGSGKSNIADAIRWVLGEQSARTLRGTKMEDVIFAGSATRRSINFCEVSLTLDNVDHHLPVVFDEVTITRRVYRSGESEYLINSQTCRLKDVHELFMDSGLGRESYSIIGQGRIEEMLSTRPEDRRGPFEDAAGIVKFKFRRKEAERKLEETQANLVRVDDILAELTEQAGPLEGEATRAQAYKGLADRLKELDIALLVNDIDGLKSRWSNAAAQVGELSENRSKVAVEVEDLDNNMKQTRLLLESKTLHIDNLQSEYVTTVANREKAEGERALLHERAENLKHSLVDKDARKSEFQDEIQSAKAALAKVNEDLNAVKIRLLNKQADLDLANESLDSTAKERFENEIEQLNSEIIDLHHHGATYRNEVKTAEESMAQDDRKKERYVNEREKWSADAAQLEGLVQQYDLVMGERKLEVRTIQSELEHATSMYREATKKEADLVGVVHQAQSELASLKSRLDLLKDLEQGYDGYALGVKTVMQANTKGKLSGIRGSIAALIQVNKSYEQAIETALGAAVQNIVVETEAHARAAISLLKERQAGRATFMPLDVIKSRLLSSMERDKVQHLPGFVGIASELVRTEAPFAHIVEYLLGNVVIAKELVHANELAKKLGYRVRIVTLGGDVVSPGGIMSGGSHSRKGPGLLGRSRERVDLEHMIAEKTQAEQSLVQAQRNLRNETMMWQQQASEKTDLLRQTEQTLVQLTRLYDENQVKLRSAQERLSGLEWEWSQLQSGQESLKARVQEATKNLKKVDEEIIRANTKMEEVRLVLANWENAAIQAREHVTKLRVDVATLTQERDALVERRKEITQRADKMEERMRQLLLESSECENQIVQTDIQVKAAEHAIHESFAAVAEMEKRLSDMKQARFEVELQAQSIEKNLRTKQRALNELDETLHRAEVMAERADVELNHALTKMSEVYQMTYEWAKSHYPLADSPESVRKLSNQLQREIQSLGDVNLGAIDEWQRLSERLEFLNRQQADLMSAIDQLSQVIAEIDDEMARRFMDTFEQIRTEFQVSFKQLFNGGIADLELTNPDNPLGTGIEVIAQPPGKRLQNLNLMSGGERALTAMALLFAILRVRPVPFCVLDEVEAALDEANVGRFAKQLRVFCDETQFIVITHRRGTMEEADALYGVTMQESGVSSLIGVRLSDDADFETA